MDIDSQNKETQRTFKDYGWNVDEIDNHDIENSHLIYLFDYNSKSARVFSVNKMDLENYKVKRDYAIPRCVSYIQRGLKAFLNGTLNKMEKAQYAGVISNYIKQTQNYQWNIQDLPASHTLHIILNVCSVNRFDATITPIIFVHENSIIHSKQIIELSKLRACQQFEQDPGMFRAIGNPASFLFNKI